MLKKYLQILDESLDKKIEILTAIEAKSKEQAELIEHEASFEDIDANMDAKAELIEQVMKLDEGFDAMYKNIKENLEAQKAECKDQIAGIQEKIKAVMAKSTSIEAIEARNKAAMEKRFAVAHKDNKQRMTSADAVRDYYKVANKLNAITPQFMDQKK